MAVAFLGRGEIGGNKGHLGVPFVTYLGVVWTKVGDCGDIRRREAPEPTALETDKETNTTFWRDAIAKEMKTVMCWTNTLRVYC